MARRAAWILGRVIGAAALLCGGVVARADIDPNSGIDFVRITAVGNPAWQGDGFPGDVGIGRGSVNYEYRIGKYEVSTAQWVEFFNAAYDRAPTDRLPFMQPPDFNYWGAVSTTPNTPGGARWRVPAGNEMRPVGSITWRTAAMYCNWLTNNKSSDRAAFLSGAYDVSTFGLAPVPGGSGALQYTDQATRSPGARYWIPSLDEWMKAAHFDPNKNGPGQAGWWRFSTSSDTLPTYGPPGQRVNPLGPVPDPTGPLAQANAGWSQGGSWPGFSPFVIPLGAYSNVTSPWGLFDAAGATSEWTEEYFGPIGRPQVFRRFDGSAWAGSAAAERDAVYYFQAGDFPDSPFLDYGLRIATNVPSPGLSALGVVVIFCGVRKTRRRRSLSIGSGRSCNSSLTPEAR